MAWYWQTSAHLPQAVHLAASTCGIWMHDVLAALERRLQEQVRVGAFDVAVQEGRRTANGRPGVPSARLSARLVATVVLPVPPLPLATAIRQGRDHPPLMLRPHGCAGPGRRIHLFQLCRR